MKLKLYKHKKNTEKYLTKKHLIVICGIIIVCITLGTVFSKNIQAFMLANKLLPLPETFTELYFEHHLQLPATVYPNTLESFSFTVHNLEYKTTSYPYEVYIDTNGQKQMIDKNTFTLKQDQYKTLAENFILSNPATRSAVVVNLINLNQQIDFWIDGVQQETPVPGNPVVANNAPTPIPKKYGAWYWQPSVGKAQMWLGTDKNGNDIWVDRFPTPTPTPTSAPSSNASVNPTTTPTPKPTSGIPVTPTALPTVTAQPSPTPTVQTTPTTQVTAIPTP